jgi:hypothetical protein
MPVSKRGHRTIGKLQWPPNIELCRSRRPANDGLVAFCSQQSPRNIAPLVDQIIALPATTLTADRSLKSCSAAALSDGCACKGSAGPQSSPCTTCSVPIHGSASSVCARHLARPSDACCSRGISRKEDLLVWGRTIVSSDYILILLETEDIGDHVIRLSLREDEVGHIPMG